MFLALVAQLLCTSQKFRDADVSKLRPALSVPYYRKIRSIVLNLQEYTGFKGMPGKSLAQEICQALIQLPEIDSAVAVYPRVYFDLHREVIIDLLEKSLIGSSIGSLESARKTIVNVGFCSPNANKPLHLGHARNMFLGMAISRLMERRGHRTLKICVFSDIGTHILKSLIVFNKKYAGSFPHGMALDEIAGLCYREYDEAPSLYDDAEELLIRYLSGNPGLVSQVRDYTSSIIRCFMKTFEEYGVSFDKTFRETDNLPWIDSIIKRLKAEGLLIRENDKSAYIMPDTLDGEKVFLLRKGGSPLYFSQLLATFLRRFDDYEPKITKVYAVVGAEQEEILNKLKHIQRYCGIPYGERILHVKYGLVSYEGQRIRSRSSQGFTLNELSSRLTGHFEKELQRFRAQRPGSAAEYSRAHLIHFFLRVPRMRRMNFQLGNALNLGQNSLFQVVKMLHLLRRSIEAPELLSPSKKIEKLLLHQLMFYPTLVVHAIDTMEPSVLIQYGLNVSRLIQDSNRRASSSKGNQRKSKLARITSYALNDSAILCNLDLSRAAPYKPNSQS